MTRHTWMVLALTLALTLACARGDDPRSSRGRGAADTLSSAGDVDTMMSVAGLPANEAGSRVSRDSTHQYPVVHGLYLNRFAAQSSRKLAHLLAVADSTEINAFVIDMKDEFGLNYVSADPAIRRNSGDGSHGIVRDVKALVDSVRAHGLLPIARIVAFKDPVAAAANPEWTIRREDGSPWNDKEGLAWVNAHDKRVWEYNLHVALELVKLGFAEIQWDYIRFPEPYRSLPKQVFPGATLSKPDALAAFLRLANERLDSVGVRNTADVFGLVTTVKGALEVGQQWEKLSPVSDVLLPMVYPSHYPRGAFGVDRPNAEPYKIIRTALDTARARDGRLGIRNPEHVRAWLQAFSIGKPEYGPEQIRQQKQAVYDAGYHGWILWSPGSHYDAFVPGLEKEKPCAYSKWREVPLCAGVATATAGNGSGKGE